MSIPFNPRIPLSAFALPPDGELSRVKTCGSMPRRGSQLVFLLGSASVSGLPHDPEILQRMLVDVTTQLDMTQRLLRQLLTARIGESCYIHSQ